EGIAWWPPRIVGVAHGGERPLLAPAIDTSERDAIVRSPPPGLEVIGDHDPDPLNSGPTQRARISQPCGAIARQPERQRSHDIQSSKPHDTSALSIGTLCANAPSDRRPTSECAATATGASNGGTCARGVRAHTMDCVPRKKVISPRNSAAFIAMK